MLKPNPIQGLRFIGRSKKTPMRVTPTSESSIRHEEFKSDHHQLALVFSIAPLVVLLLGAKDFDAINSIVLRLSATALVVCSALSGFLRVCLIVVSKNRIRILIAAQNDKKESVKLFFISLRVQFWSEVLALLGYFSMAVFLLASIWT